MRCTHIIVCDFKTSQTASSGEMLLDRDGDNSDEELNHDDADIYQTLFFQLFSDALSVSVQFR